MFFTTWSKRSSKVLFAAAMTGLLWLWPAEAKPAGQPKPTPTLYTVDLSGDVTGLGENFKYSLSKSPPRWVVESLGDGSPVTLTFTGAIAKHIAALGISENPLTVQLTGNLVIQHNRSDSDYNYYTAFHFYWKRPELKLSYSLRIYGLPPDPLGAFLYECTIDFTKYPDPELLESPELLKPGAPYYLTEFRGGQATPKGEGVTYFTIAVPAPLPSP